MKVKNGFSDILHSLPKKESSLQKSKVKRQAK
jgi:hypothetical protein